MGHVLKSCNKENMEQFIKALRSGEFPQGKGRLCRLLGTTRHYCCLGVACVEACNNGLNLVIEQYQSSKNADIIDLFDNESAVLPHSVRNWLEIEDNDPELHIPKYLNKFISIHRKDIRPCASKINDIWNFTLDQISDCFEHTYLRDLDE